MERKVDKKISKYETEKQKEIVKRNEFLTKSQMIIDEYDYKLKNLNSIKKEFEKINKKAKDFFDKIEGGNSNDKSGK